MWVHSIVLWERGKSKAEEKQSRYFYIDKARYQGLQGKESPLTSDSKTFWGDQDGKEAIAKAVASYAVSEEANGF